MAKGEPKQRQFIKPCKEPGDHESDNPPTFTGEGDTRKEVGKCKHCGCNYMIPRPESANS